MSSSDILLIGGVGALAYIYYQSNYGIPNQFDNILTDITNTISNATGASGDSDFASKPKPNPNPTGAGGLSDTPQWFQTVTNLNDELLKPLVGDMVIGKAVSALVNESGQRKALAEYRANQAMQKKQELAMKKLAVMEQAKAKYEAIGNTYKAKIEAARIAKGEEKLKKIENLRAGLAADKANIIKSVGERTSAQIRAQYGVDAIKARQESLNQAKLISKDKTNKPSFAIFKQRIQNRIARSLNYTRVQFGKHMNSIKIPKFTTRGAVHTSASLFGLIVGAYDLVRMFDPRIDIWKKERQGEVPYQVEKFDLPPDFNEKPPRSLPLCDDVVESGEANPTNPIICRERRPKPWETLSWNNLSYKKGCPPGFLSYSHGVYERCTLVTGSMGGEYITRDSWPRKASNWEFIVKNSGYDIDTKDASLNNASGDYVISNNPNLWEVVPNDFLVRLGLRGFVDNLNTQLGVVSYGVSGTVPPPDWRPDEAYSTEPIPMEWNRERFGGGEMADVDWPYQQFRNTSLWGDRPEGAVNTGSRFLADFNMPYTDVGVSMRGGESLTDRERIIKLFPDATEDEINSAVTNSNAEISNSNL